MDSLKSLLDKKNYDLVLKLTETSKEGTDLFYRISAFTCLGKYEDALYVIQDNQQALEKSGMYALINIHINLLCSLGRYDQAYSVYDYYSNLPYESQIVEELLRKIPDVIAMSEKKDSGLCINEDEIIKNLNSENEDEVLFGLDTLKKLDINDYLPEISKILVKEGRQVVRSFALMLLLSKNVNNTYNFLSYKGLIKVNPSQLKEPFKGEIFNHVLRRLDQVCKNVTLVESGAQLLSNYVIYTFPEEIKVDIEELVGAIYLYSKKLIHDGETTITDYAVTNNLQEATIKKYFDILDIIVKEM